MRGRYGNASRIHCRSGEQPSPGPKPTPEPASERAWASPDRHGAGSPVWDGCTTTAAGGNTTCSAGSRPDRSFASRTHARRRIATGPLLPPGLRPMSRNWRRVTSPSGTAPRSNSETSGFEGSGRCSGENPLGVWWSWEGVPRGSAFAVWDKMGPPIWRGRWDGLRPASSDR